MDQGQGQDLSEALHFIDVELMRLGLNKHCIEVLLLCKSYGYSRFEELDLPGMRMLWLDLRKCLPSGVRLHPNCWDALEERLRRLEDKYGLNLREG